MFSVNWELLHQEFGFLYGGARLTLVITFSALVIGVALGLVLAILRLSPRWWVNLPVTAYVEVFRGTPMLVQVLLFSQAIFPGIQDVIEHYQLMQWLDMSWTGISWMNLTWVNFRRMDTIYPGILALGLNSGAYLGEIFRGGILSIDRGQREAALSLGMRSHQVMWYVVLPQAFTNALPSIGNEFITLLKDSSLLSTIAVMELTYRGNAIASTNYEQFTAYVGIAVIYFSMTFPISRFLSWVEKRRRVGSK